MAQYDIPRYLGAPKKTGPVLTVTRLGADKDISREVDRIVVTYKGMDYTITPDHSGIRVHKHSIDEAFTVEPGCANEIILK